MTDIFSRRKRSEIMQKVKSKDTKPELLFARYLRKQRIKYRRNVTVKGHKVDFKLLGKKSVVFVHGCFWHGCRKCRTIPQTNRRFWEEKIHMNRRRDARVRRKLLAAGWKVRCIWEHELEKGVTLKL